MLISAFTLRPTVRRPNPTSTPVQYAPMASVRFGGKTTDATPDNGQYAKFLILQQQAQAKRQAMPMVVQSLFPLKNDKVTPAYMKQVEQALAEHPTLTPEALAKLPAIEKPYFDMLRMLFPLVKRSGDFGRHDLAREVEYTKDPLYKELIVDLMIDDGQQSSRYDVCKAVGDYRDPKRRDDLILKMDKDAYELIQANAVEFAHLLTDQAQRDAMLERRAADPKFTWKSRLAEAAQHMTDPDKLNTVIRRTLITAHDSATRTALIPAAKKSNNAQLKAMVFESIALDSQQTYGGDVVKELIPGLDDTNMIVDMIEGGLKKSDYGKYDLAKAVGQIADAGVRDQVIEKLLTPPTDQKNDFQKNRFCTGLMAMRYHSNGELKDKTYEANCNHPDEHVRYCLAHTLEMSDPARQDGVIMKMIRDPEKHVKEEAIKLIPKMSDVAKRDAAIERLCRSRNDGWYRLGMGLLPLHSNANLRNTLIAHNTVEKEAEVYGPADALVLADTTVPNRDALLLHMAGKHGNVEALDQLKADGKTDLYQQALVKLAGSKDRFKQEIVAKRLADIPDTAERAGTIVKIAKRAEYSVNHDAVAALKALGDPVLIDKTIVRIFKETQEKAHEAAADLIPFINNAKLRDQWLEALAGDAEHKMRYVAAKNLDKIADPVKRDQWIEKLVTTDNLQGTAGEWLHLHSNEAWRDTELEKIVKFAMTTDYARYVLDHLITPAIHTRNLALQKSIFIPLLSHAKDSNNRYGDGLDYKYCEVVKRLPEITDKDTLIELMGVAAKSGGEPGIAKLAETLTAMQDSPYRTAILDGLRQQTEPWGPALATAVLGTSQESPEAVIAQVRELGKKETYSFKSEKLIEAIAEPAKRDTVIETMVASVERNEKALGAKMLHLHSNPEKQMVMLKQLSLHTDSYIISCALDTAVKINRQRMKGFAEALPNYHEAIEAGLKETLAEYNGTAERPFGVVDGMMGLLALGLLDQDGGQLKKSLLPQYKQVLAFAKTEVNKHLPPNQKPYTPEDIENVFEHSRHGLLTTLAMFGPGPLRFKLTQGMGKFNGFLDNMQGIVYDDNLVKQLSQTSSEFTLSPNDTTQLCELSAGFGQLGQGQILTDFLKEASTKKALNLGELGGLYLKAFAQSCNLIVQNMAQSCGTAASSDPESYKKWNLAYMPALADAYRQFDEDTKALLKEVIEATLANRFDQYLVDPKTEVGKANLATATAYKDAGLDINKWLKHSTVKDFEVTNDAELSDFNSLLDELSGELVKLIGSRKQAIDPLVGDDIRKQLFQFVKGKGYQFNDELLLTSQNPQHMLNESLAHLADGVLKFLTDKQVIADAEKTGKQEIITVKSHLEQLTTDLKATKSPELIHNGKFQIKTWDRNPGYDLFQGNYSQCCIAINHCNRAAIVEYLTSHAMQIVEVKDQNTGKTMANTFLYWAKDKNNKNILVADNVEIAAQYRDNTARALLANLTEFLKDYAKSVNGGKTTQVLLGPNYNDVPTGKLAKDKFTLQFIGTNPDGQMYLDSINCGSWSNIAKPHTRSFNIL